jgi:hypothetical protein
MLIAAVPAKPTRRPADGLQLLELLVANDRSDRQTKHESDDKRREATIPRITTTRTTPSS